MRQPLQEHGAWGLFDVEIGQFESVSFNFSQLTGPPWVPHIPLIGYKLVFLSSHSLIFKPLFSLSLLHITQVYPCYYYFFFLNLLPFSLLKRVVVSPPMFVKQSVISIKLHLYCL